MHFSTAFVYELKSLKNGNGYIESIGFEPEEELKRHNYGASKFAKRNSPFELIYQESYLTRTEARKRENFLKSGAGRNYLDEIFRNR